MDQLQRQSRAAEPKLIFHTHVGCVDFHPIRLDLAGGVEKLQLSILGPTFPLGRTLDAPLLGLFELAEVSDDSLARPAFCAMGLDQRPIRDFDPCFLAW